MMTTTIAILVSVFAAAMSRVNEIETIYLPVFESEEETAVLEKSYAF